MGMCAFYLPLFSRYGGILTAFLFCGRRHIINVDGSGVVRPQILSGFFSGGKCCNISEYRVLPVVLNACRDSLSLRRSGKCAARVMANVDNMIVRMEVMCVVGRYMFSEGVKVVW